MAAAEGLLFQSETTRAVDVAVAGLFFPSEWATDTVLGVDFCCLFVVVSGGKFDGGINRTLWWPKRNRFNLTESKMAYFMKMCNIGFVLVETTVAAVRAVGTKITESDHRAT